MNGGNNQQNQTLREEIANILPQQKPSAPPQQNNTPPPSRPSMPPQKQPAPQPKMENQADQKFVLRTMPSDLDSLKKGEQPGGLNVEKSGKTAPRPSKPSAPPPKLKMGPIEKSSPITPPSSPQVAPKSSPKVPDVGVLPPKSGEISPPPPAATPPPSKPATPSAGKKGNLLGVIIIVLGLAILAYAAIWFFVLREEPIPSPTPTATPTPTPVLNELEATFGPAIPLTISSSDVSPQATLSQAIDSELVNLNEIKPFVVVDENGTQYDFVSLMELLGVSVPVDLASTLDSNNYLFLIYGQTEEFDEQGNLVLTTGSSARFKRIGFVVEAVSPSATQTAMTVWEEDMMAALDDLLQLSENQPDTAGFNDNLYNGVDIRFVNYPNPDLSIDYAVSSSADGNNYLVITNSREEIYSVVDNLLGFLAE